MNWVKTAVNSDWTQWILAKFLTCVSVRLFFLYFQVCRETCNMDIISDCDKYMSERRSELVEIFQLFDL